MTDANPMPAAPADPARTRTTFVLAVLVFLAAFGVYLRTLTPTVPFWDAGEFITVSKILGIPHPPGTPFYVLLGHIASMVPIATVAQRVNGLSALVSALAVMLTYLTTLRLIRIARRRGVAEAPEAAPAPAGWAAALRSDWIAHAGAVLAALMLAFSDNFWENATEAEVYSMMSLAQVLVLWLALRWWEAHDRRPTVGPLLVAVYVMWLSVGLHLGVGMMGLPLVVLLLLVDRNVAVLFAVPVISVLGVTYGLEKMAGIVLALSVLVFWVYAAQRKLPTWLALAATALAAWGAYYAFTDAPFTPVAAAAAAAAVVVPIVALALRHREGRILALALFLMLAGYSTHLYLPIRAAQHPAINMGTPDDWPRLKALLEREQYGHTSMSVRRGTWRNQLDKEFWRYVKRQWPLVHGALDREAIPAPPEPRWWSFLLPLALGGLGGWWQARRERVSFLTMLVLVLFSTVGMILFLNFSNQEVRDRDYFFTTFYHAYAIWMGLGFVFLVGWVRDSFRSPSSRTAVTAAAAALLGLQPFLVLGNLWYFHDRSRNYVAHDYAWNMLAPLAPNSYVFTNGDNDTYPLWYIQNVENFRKDVRVVCLALLQTDWYILQLRDQEPRLPITLPDDVIRGIGGGAFQDQSGRVVYTNDFMVRHLIENSRRGRGWSKQPYFAVTAPEHRGYDPFLTLEGLVDRVNPDTVRSDIDVPATERNLNQVFKYRGLFLPDGSWDRSIYKDENAVTLTRNYASAHQRLSFWWHDHGRLDLAIAEMERVRRMFPDYPGALIPLGIYQLQSGDTTHAVALFRKAVAEDPRNPEAHYYYGVGLGFRGDANAAIAEYDEAIRLDPTYPRPYYAAYLTLGERGQFARGFEYIRQLLQVNPQDPQARQIMQMVGERMPNLAPTQPPGAPPVLR